MVVTADDLPERSQQQGLQQTGRDMASRSAIQAKVAGSPLPWCRKFRVAAREEGPARADRHSPCLEEDSANVQTASSAAPARFCGIIFCFMVGWHHSLLDWQPSVDRWCQMRPRAALVIAAQAHHAAEDAVLEDQGVRQRRAEMEQEGGEQQEGEPSCAPAAGRRRAPSCGRIGGRWNAADQRGSDNRRPTACPSRPAARRTSGHRAASARRAAANRSTAGMSAGKGGGGDSRRLIRRTATSTSSRMPSGRWIATSR